MSTLIASVQDAARRRLAVAEHSARAVGSVQPGAGLRARAGAVIEQRPGSIPLAWPCGLYVIEAYAMALAHQNLAVAVGAAKEHARTGRTPPPLEHFVPDLEQLTRVCGDRLASVKPLVEAALGVARGTPGQA